MGNAPIKKIYFNNCAECSNNVSKMFWARSAGTWTVLSWLLSASSLSHNTIHSTSRALFILPSEHSLCVQDGAESWVHSFITETCKQNSDGQMMVLYPNMEWIGHAFVLAWLCCLTLLIICNSSRNKVLLIWHLRNKSITSLRLQ
jgi:hypothetical protein